MKKWKMLMLSMSGLMLIACSGGANSTSSQSQSQSSEATASTEAINMSVPTELMTMDSVLAQDMNSSNAIGATNEGLYRRDKDGIIIPALAVDLPEVSEDGLTYTIKVREDATWSNGDPITANDFVFAWQRAVTPATGAAYSYLFEPMENAPAIMTGDKEATELGAKALDDYTIEIKLTTPTPYMKDLLGFTTFYPLNEKFVTEQGEKYGTTADTTLYNGPYVLENWDGTNLTWDYAKNTNYYDQDVVKTERIHNQVIKEVTTGLNLYESGQISNAQITGELVQQYKDHADAVTQKQARSSYLEFNHTKEILQNQNLRKAVSLVLNRDELANSIMANGSTPLTSWIPDDFYKNPETGEEFYAAAGNLLDYNVEEAKAAFAKAKKELGVDTIELHLVGDDDETNKKISQYIQGQLENNLDGLKVSIQNVPKKVRLELSSRGEFDIVQSGWFADYADPTNFLDLLVSGVTYNFGKYSNTEYDAVVNSAKATNANDPAKRWDDMQNAQKIALADYALVPLFQEAELQLRDPSVQNLYIYGVGTQYEFKYLEKVQ